MSHYKLVLESRSGMPARQRKESLLFDLNASDVDLYTCLTQCDDSVYPAVANNFACCAMHLGRVDTAISALESVVQEDPFHHLQDPLVFNLCTLYDISCAAPLAELKKKSLKNVAEIYWISDAALNWKSFRLASY